MVDIRPCNFVFTDFMVTWTGQFKEGQQVQMLYDPNNPSDFTILNNQSPRLRKLIMILAGFNFFGHWDLQVLCYLKAMDLRWYTKI